jgi:hypothetical protein
VIDPGQLALIHAEIDGELDAAQRAELARALLADPPARALRDDLRLLCLTLDAVEPVEPPLGLRESILAAMPQTAHTSRGFELGSGFRSGSAVTGWRLAAMFAGVLLAGTLLFALVRSPTPEPSEVVGTIALAPAATLVDSVQLAKGPVSGRVSLYRDRAALALRFEVTVSTPVDARVASEGRMLQIVGIGIRRNAAPGTATAVPLPGVPMHGQSIDVTFLSGGHPIGMATLRAPRGP